MSANLNIYLALMVVNLHHTLFIQIAAGVASALLQKHKSFIFYIIVDTSKCHGVNYKGPNLKVALQERPKFEARIQD